MKEIGGFFEFEELKGKEYYANLLDFNIGRNCLRYIIRKRKISEIYLPVYLCDVIYKVCKEENLKINFYNIDSDFLPILSKKIINSNKFIYLVNYFGFLSNGKIKKYFGNRENVILDNTHAFFQKPIKGMDVIYNCRKYFGVPDGAYLYSNLPADDFELDKSKDRFNHLLGRYENNASDFYSEFQKTDLLFEKMKIKKMSKLTKNIMKAIDYKKVLKMRKSNIKYLNLKLKKYNNLKLNLSNMNFMYPLLLDDADKLRNNLIGKKIYIPKLWPNIVEEENLNNQEKKFINIIFLPIDQRYNFSDMEEIIEIIEEELNDNFKRNK